MYRHHCLSPLWPQPYMHLPLIVNMLCVTVHVMFCLLTAQMHSELDCPGMCWHYFLKFGPCRIAVQGRIYVWWSCGVQRAGAQTCQRWVWKICAHVFVLSRVISWDRDVWCMYAGWGWFWGPVTQVTPNISMTCFKVWSTISFETKLPLMSSLWVLMSSSWTAPECSWVSCECSWVAWRYELPNWSICFC